MRLKFIASLPVLDRIKTKKEHVARCQCFDDTIVIDCYLQGQWHARYATDHKNYSMWYGSEWHNRKFCTGFRYDALWNYGKPTDLQFADDVSKMIFEDFFKDDYSWSDQRPASVINRLENRMNEEKRDRAYYRKCQRIEALMSKVPPLPSDLEEWVHRAWFNSAEYAFGSKGSDKYFCTACGKYHTFKNGKHNQQRTCRATGKTVTIKRRQAAIDKTVRVIVIQQVDDDYSVIRYCDARFGWCNTGTGKEIYENARIMTPRSDKGKFKIFYGQQYRADEFEQSWWDARCRNFVFYGYAKVYPVGVREALAGTEYDGFAVQAMADANCTANYNGIMWAGSDFPAEYLFKGRFHRLMKEESMKCCYGNYYGALKKYGKNASQVFGVNMQRVNRLRQIDGGTVQLKWLRYEEETEDRVSADSLSWLDSKKLSPDELESITARMSLEKAVHYIQKQSDIAHRSARDIVETFKDYLSMAIRMKMNLSAEQIYKPKDLIAAHDDLVRRINLNADKAEAIAMGKKFPLCSKVLKTLGMYEWGDDEYVVKVPKNIVDIINEGRALSHCVGSSERYFDRIAQRESYILFLRRASAPDHPYYTLEVEPGGVIRQKRTTGDKQLDDIKDAVDFLRRWQSVIQKRLTEKERALQKEARRLRNEEFKQLRKDRNTIWHGPMSGKLLVDVLEKDLMELEIA